MPHRHSPAQRQARYHRAVARGWLQRRVPVGSLRPSCLAYQLPSTMRPGFRTRCEIMQTALASHMLIAHFVGATDCLGRAYQLVRGRVLPAVASGVRKVNDAFIAVRHRPSLNIRMPVDGAFLARLRAQLEAHCRRAAAEQPHRFLEPLQAPLCAQAAPFVPEGDTVLLQKRLSDARVAFWRRGALLHEIMVIWRIQCGSHFMGIVRSHEARDDDEFFECETDARDVEAYDPWDYIEMEELCEPVPLQRLCVVDLRLFQSPGSISSLVDCAPSAAVHVHVLPRVMLGPFLPQSNAVVIKGFPDFWLERAINKWLSACLGNDWVSRFNVVGVRFPCLEGKVVVTFACDKDCQAFFTNSWTTVPTIPIRTEDQAKLCGVQYCGVATLHIRMKPPTPPVPNSAVAPTSDDETDTD